MGTYIGNGVASPITLSVPAGNYIVTVKANNSAGFSVDSTSVSVTASSPPTSIAPLIVPAINGSGASLRTVGSSNRLKLAGVAVWGISDFIASSNGNAADQYTNKTAVCNAIKALGANIIRLRVLGDEYTYNNYFSKTDYIQKVKDWRDAAKAAGLYLMICAWDSLDSQHGWSGVGWASNYSQVFPMFSAIYSALKLSGGVDDPYVFYEPFNEPNGITTSQWLTAMQGTIAQFRSALGYQGLLVLDTTQWSHTYDDGSFSSLESYDAARTASGKHNLAFARHDYTDDYGNNWNGVSWINSTGGNSTAHVIMETEFGNQNGSNQNDTFSAAETAYYKTSMFNRSNIAGGTAFLWKWVDKNTITSSSTTNALASPWGNDVANWLSGV